VASNGSLVPVPGSPFITADYNYALAIAPSGKFLYATGTSSTGDGEISAYSIDPTTGALAQLPGSPYTIVPYNCANCETGDYFFDLTTDRNGNFLIGSGYVNGVIYVYRINTSTGALTSVPGSPFVDSLPCGPGCPSASPTSVTVSGNNGFVFAQNITSNNLARFKLNAVTGALTLEGTADPPYGASLVEDCVRADPSGSFVYALGYAGGNGAVIGYSITQSDGTLIGTPGSPYPDKGTDSSAAVDGIAVTR
jgi:hypothetical protein